MHLFIYIINSSTWRWHRFYFSLCVCPSVTLSNILILFILPLQSIFLSVTTFYRRSLNFCVGLIPCYTNQTSSSCWKTTLFFSLIFKHVFVKEFLATSNCRCLEFSHSPCEAMSYGRIYLLNNYNVIFLLNVDFSYLVYKFYSRGFTLSINSHIFYFYKLSSNNISV